MGEGMTDDDIALDRQLQTQGNEVDESLGALRFRKCVTEGMDYSVWADKVGVTSPAVRQSVERHARAHGLNLNPVSIQRAKTERNPKGAGRKRGALKDKRGAPATFAVTRARDAETRVRNYASALGTVATAVLRWDWQGAVTDEARRDLLDCINTLRCQLDRIEQEVTG